MVDQTCNEGNCADEDCDGEKAAYEAALKKRIRLLLRLNRTFVRGWTQAALKSGLKRFRSERLRPSPISKIRRNKLLSETLEYRHANVEGIQASRRRMSETRE